MPYIASCDAEIVVVADSDCWTDGLTAAAAAVVDGAPWAIPHHFVHRLTEVGSDRTYAGGRWQKQPLEQMAYRGVAGGGFVIARPKDLLDVPLDSRFVGWGQEDESWARALRTLLGEPYRGMRDLAHLWHPPQERLTRKIGSVGSRALARRYHAATGQPAQMRALIEEIPPCL